MGSFVLVAYARLAASKTLLQWLLACLNFTLDSEDLSFWHKRKKLFLWAMVAAQAAKHHGDEWGLNWYFRWGIHTTIPTWTHTQNSLVAEEALSLTISLPWSISQMITKTVPISRKIVISNPMKRPPYIKSYMGSIL